MVNSLSTATLEKDGDFVLAKPLAIALIGSSESRRQALSGILAEYAGIQVDEFTSYPTNLNTVARLLAQQFDIVIVDMDSESKVALDLVESIRGETAVTVIPYTEEAEPELMARCRRAGAREYLVAPVRRSTLDRIIARARIGLPSHAQPAHRPVPQAIAEPKTDVRRDDPPPVSAPVRREDEDLRPQSKQQSEAIAVPKTDVRRDDPPPVSAPVHREDEDLRQASTQQSEAIVAPETSVRQDDPPPVSVPVSAPVHREDEDLRQASKQPSEAIAAPKSDVRRDNPLPVSAPVHSEDEDLRQASKQAREDRDAAQDLRPAAASHEQVTDRGFDNISSPPLWSGRVIVEEIRFTPEAKPLAAPAEDQDSSRKPGTAQPGNRRRTTAAEQWATFFSVVSVAPVLSNGAAEPRKIVEPVKKTPTLETIRYPAANPSLPIFEPVQKTPTLETDPKIGALAFHSDLADLGDDDSDRKKWVRVGAAGFAVLVLLLFVGPRLLTPAKRTLAAQPAPVLPVASDPAPSAKTPKPRPSKTLDEGHSTTANNRPTSIANVEEAMWPKADAKLAPPDAKNASPQVDSTMMTNQLASAPQIPQDVKMRRKEEAPPSAGFDAANPEEMGSGAVVAGGIFSKQTRPAVSYVPPAPVVIPVKVAEELLIHKTLPTYPPFAWKNYISGKVVLEAIVSETGSVESLKVVSGPQALQHAAFDAVKSWRYKPYIVNGRPARVQTTIMLVFNPYR